MTVNPVIAALAACSLALASGPLAAQTQVTWGAAPATSPYYSFSVGFSNAAAAENPSLRFTVTETNGAFDISNRIRRKQVDLGIANSATDYGNFHGSGAFKTPNKDARILFYLDQAGLQWVVRADSGVTNLSQLTGKAFSPGSAGSAAVKQTQEAFQMMGISPQWYQGGQADMGRAFQDRQIIGLTKVGPLPDAFVQQLIVSTPVRLLGLTEQQAKLIDEKLPTFTITKVPAGVYPGQDQALTIAASLLGVQTDSRMPAETSYALAKLAFEGKDKWADAYPAARKFDQLELTLQSKLPLAAGTVRYLREKGVQVPQQLIPAEFTK
jgi:uncharacterized protein